MISNTGLPPDVDLPPGAVADSIPNNAFSDTSTISATTRTTMGEQISGLMPPYDNGLDAAQTDFDMRGRTKAMLVQVVFTFFLIAVACSVCVFVLSALGYYLNRNVAGGGGDERAADEREEKENARSAARKKERGMWYEYYLKPFSVVIKRSDLFYVREGQDDSKESSGEGRWSCQERSSNDGGPVLVQVDDDDIQQLSLISNNNNNSEFSGDSDDEEIGESGIEKQAAAAPTSSTRSLACDDEDDDDEDAALCANLPPVGDETVPRVVDGTCALCLDEYKEGDTVVWSNLKCPHAFHKECIMQWLSKGRKHCPICRDWYVPGSRIDDQKKAHGAAWKRALKEMKRREEKENKARAAIEKAEPTCDDGKSRP